MQFLCRAGHVSGAPGAQEGVDATRERTDTNYGSAHTSVAAFGPVAPTGRRLGELPWTVMK